MFVELPLATPRSTKHLTIWSYTSFLQTNTNLEFERSSEKKVAPPGCICTTSLLNLRHFYFPYFLFCWKIFEIRFNSSIWSDGWSLSYERLKMLQNQLIFMLMNVCFNWSIIVDYTQTVWTGDLGSKSVLLLLAYLYTFCSFNVFFAFWFFLWGFFGLCKLAYCA